MFGRRAPGRQGSWLTALALALRARRGRWKAKPKVAPEIPWDVWSRNETYFAQMQFLRWR